MSWFKKKNHVDPDELAKKAEEAASQIRDQQQHVNSITAYLINRKMTNGFGTDFEYTLKPKGTN